MGRPQADRPQADRPPADAPPRDLPTLLLGRREVPFFDHDEVIRRVSAAQAITHVRDGFEHYARGEWTMPSKVYLFSPPFGDFRAMPAIGDGLAIVKWVSSFPKNSGRGIATVHGVLCVNDAETGEVVALVDGPAVTELRTGASAAIAATALAPSNARSVGIIGCGSHGSWAARCLDAAGFGPGICCDHDPAAAERLAAELGWLAGSREEALTNDIITTVTPGATPVIATQDIRPGIHINGLGADGPDKREMEVNALLKCKIFCDEWDQASHGGEISGAVDAGSISHADVTQLGDILAGTDSYERNAEDVTFFDSTGLAIQDLAIVRALLNPEKEPPDGTAAAGNDGRKVR